MENKKTKLTISGSSKKTIKNIEKIKTQGKHSVVIEKKTNKFHKKGSPFKPSFSKPNISFKPSVPGKNTGQSDFERRKLAEQIADETCS